MRRWEAVCAPIVGSDDRRVLLRHARLRCACSLFRILLDVLIQPPPPTLPIDGNGKYKCPCLRAFPEYRKGLPVPAKGGSAVFWKLALVEYLKAKGGPRSPEMQVLTLDRVQEHQQ